MKSRNIFLAITLILAVNQVNIVESAVYDLIRTLLQWNVAGIPLIHERREFDFDPDISIKRRQLFYELNGFRAAKYIERIGLGIDGKHHERLEEQKIRDEGKLQGLNLFTP